MSRKRVHSTKDDVAPKRMNMDVNVAKKEDIEFCDLDGESRQDKFGYANETKQCIPYQLIRLMYHLDLSVLCLLRNSIYNNKYPLLTFAFGDSNMDKFSDITLCYKEKSILVHIESVDKYYTDNDIGYAKLFNKEKEKRCFYINNYFDSFVKHYISKTTSVSNNIEYLVIYTNSGLKLSKDNKLIKERSRSFFPFEFDVIHTEECEILKDFFFANINTEGNGFYRFSKDETTRKELLKRLEFSHSMRRVINDRKLSPEILKEIKETFLDKVVFLINQPNREQLNCFIKNEINDKGHYTELQERVLLDLTSHVENKKLGYSLSDITYSFNLLMFLLHRLYLDKNTFSVNIKGKGCDLHNEIILNYRGKITCIKAYNADSNISFGYLFPTITMERKMKFSINKHFALYCKELEMDKNIRYFIIYTNTNIDLSEKMRLMKGRQCKDYYPFKLESIDTTKKKYKVLRNISCIDKKCLYRFSLEEVSKLSSVLMLPNFVQIKRQKEGLLNENEKEIKDNFLYKLIFAVSQPKEEELNSILKDEIEEHSNEVPYNYGQLHEIAMRWLESHELGSITKETMQELLEDIKCNKSSYQKNHEKNVEEEMKFAKSVAGREGTSSYNQFIDFLIKGEGRKYLDVLKRNGVSLSNISSILNKSDNNAVKSFKDLYNVWFDAKGNKTQYLTILEEEGINLPNMSSILRGARSNAANAFKELYHLWFDEKGNKTQYLITLEGRGVTLHNVSSVLNGAGSNAAKAFRDIYDLWFDSKGNKTQYLVTLEDEQVGILNMSSILHGAGFRASEAFKDLYDLWFDPKGNKTHYLKTLEMEEVNLPSMSSVLNGAGNAAAKAFKDLYDLWFDASGNKTAYLKSLDDEGVNLHHMSSILSASRVNAAKAFKELYNLWFDTKGNKTQYLRILEDEGVNLPNVSSILHGAGSNSATAFKELYDLWFDAKGNKTQYLKTLENEGVNLPNMSSILRGAGANSTKAFKELYDLWFDSKGNKTQYLKTLEDEGVNLPSMSNILGGAGANAKKAFKDLFNLWFDAQKNKTQYLKTLEDQGVNLPNMSSILGGAGTNATKAFEDLYNLWFDAQGKKTKYLETLEVQGINLPSMSSILNKAGVYGARAYKDLYDLWFDAAGNKTQYLKTLEDKGVKLPNVSSILSGAGANASKAFKELYDIWFDAKGKKNTMFKNSEICGR